MRSHKVSYKVSLEYIYIDTSPSVLTSEMWMRELLMMLMTRWWRWWPDAAAADDDDNDSFMSTSRRDSLPFVSTIKLYQNKRRWLLTTTVGPPRAHLKVVRAGIPGESRTYHLVRIMGKSPKIVVWSAAPRSHADEYNIILRQTISSSIKPVFNYLKFTLLFMGRVTELKIKLKYNTTNKLQK